MRGTSFGTPSLIVVIGDSVFWTNIRRPPHFEHQIATSLCPITFPPPASFLPTLSNYDAVPALPLFHLIDPYMRTQQFHPIFALPFLRPPPSALLIPHTLSSLWFVNHGLQRAVHSFRPPLLNQGRPSIPSAAPPLIDTLSRGSSRIKRPNLSRPLIYLYSLVPVDAIFAFFCWKKERNNEKMARGNFRFRPNYLLLP